MTGDLAREYGRPEYEVLWRQARKAVARGQVKLGYKPPDHSAADAVSALLGAFDEPPARARLAAGIGTTIVVADLDTRLRAGKFHCGLAEVLAAVHGEPAEFNPVQASVDASRREWVNEILTGALASAGLQSRAWAPYWVDHVRRYAKIPPERLAEPASRAAAILARLTLDPNAIPETWSARADLAARHGGGAHSLDRGQKLAGLVLRAAALAHGVEFPRSARDERTLWERCGVALDSVSATVLCWALPVPAMADRTAAGFPTHLTLRDLRAADLVAPKGTVVAVCENPRVVEAAVDAGATHPLVCVSGHLNTVARQLLAHLADAGAAIRHHGDFDRDGLLIARQVLDLTGGAPWRLGADDYREALDLARADEVDLPPLGAEPGPTPWDPTLPEAMRAGWAVEEEVVLDLLLADLKAGLAAA
ncbi:DUF2399 domain-containing protein [Actinokineospora iranica]|uniref:TIGR02679 family protein n=1 Tax=Actinokineospora iranica TaxID=1271860 RepID=A0A1G6R0Z4_9PSEU|nr:DUF2399 domain-containing protein [Actinokineospora iranica]SDC98103.1 TIGR02679 family protein [Actinokineospora iranica]